MINYVALFIVESMRCTSELVSVVYFVILLMLHFGVLWFWLQTMGYQKCLTCILMYLVVIVDPLPPEPGM